MNLDFFNDLINKVKESDFIQNFMAELSNYLENAKENEKNQTLDKNSSDIEIKKEDSNIMSIEEIKKKYKLDSENSKKLVTSRNEILKEEAKNLTNEDNLYYVSYKNTFKDTYQILEFDKLGKNKSFYLKKEELPEDIAIGKVIKKENDKFIIDSSMTENIMNKVEDVAKDLAQQQNSKLNQNRKEGNLYKVVSLSSNGVYLQNKENNNIFEETNISKELLDQISNDYILKYEDGKYIYDEKLTEEFFQKLKK